MSDNFHIGQIADFDGVSRQSGNSRMIDVIRHVGRLKNSEDIWGLYVVMGK